MSGVSDSSRACIIAIMLSCLLTVILLFISIFVLERNQIRAYGGDEAAAKRIVLPCYKALYKMFVLIFAILLLVLVLVASPVADWNSEAYFRAIQYISFSTLSIYSVVPVLLVQSSISITAFRTAVLVSFPWWAICTALWISGTVLVESSSSWSRAAYVAVEVLFVLLASLCPCSLCAGILLKIVPSRVQLGSTSNRNAVELLLAYSLSFGIAYICGIGSRRDSANDETASEYIWGRDVAVAVTAISCLSNVVFPWALYRTLLADTKFWRGLGKHNQGIQIHDELRESGIDIHRPTMELGVAASSFQTMMSDINDITIDFAYLQLNKLVGQGATSKVFLGKFQQRLVAVKLLTPPEITPGDVSICGNLTQLQDVIEVFVSEAKTSAALTHPNIVQFVGICVRPPSIAMVLEYCEGGNLKSHLLSHRSSWTYEMFLKACLDCSRAVAHLHQNGFIHRDIKAENFFVGAKHVVKLGDFGEATVKRNKESTKSKRMTILGTVAFMAPELIAAQKYYDEAVDVYALAVTFWEIWTGMDPYASQTHFEVYNLVSSGRRPDLSILENPPLGQVSPPPQFLSLMRRCWEQDAERRPAAAAVVAAIEAITEGKEPQDSLDSRKADAITITDDDSNSNNNSISISGDGSIHMLTRESVPEEVGDLESATGVAAGSDQPYQVGVHKAVDDDDEEGRSKGSDEALQQRASGGNNAGVPTQPDAAVSDRDVEEGDYESSGHQNNFAVSNPMLKSTGKKNPTA